MKRNFLKRSMALAVAAAVAASSLPTSFAFAEEEIVVEDAALDVVTEEEADAVVEEAAEAEAAVTAEPAEEEFVVGIETVEEGAEEAELNAGTPGTPAAVEGLTIKTVGEEGDNLPVPELHWNYVPGAYMYKIMVTDAAGRTYGYWDGKYPTVPQSYDPYTTAVYDLYAIKKTETGYEREIDADGNYIRALAPGQTYTISVCAVNAYKAAEDAETVYTDGPAASITYTTGAVVGAITDLSYVSEDDDAYYFTYGAAIAEGYVYYQISEKADFSEVYTSYDYPDEKKLDIDKDNFEAGKTYYIRAVNSTTGDIKDETWKAANVVTLAVPAKTETTLKTITGLYLYKANYDSGYFEFRFDPVLEDGDDFVLQYSKDNVTWKNTSSWSWDYNSLELSMSLLEADTTYYVRAVTGSNWGYHEDAEGNDGSYGFETYGTPSNVVTVSKTAAISAISDLVLLEKNSSGYKFSYTGSLHQGEEVEIWYSETPSFDSMVTKVTTSDTLSYEYLTPGKTYYVRARVKSYEKTDSLTGDDEALYGAFTNTVSFTASIVPKISVYASEVANKKITLNMEVGSNDNTEYVTGYTEYVTGYQIQRKNKNKWATLVKTTDSKYTDTGLTVDTTYTYRVRPYYYSSVTGKTTYGTWTVYEAMTWGASLNLKATQKAAKQVKLTWTKVKGAEGYEVYRLATFSGGTTVANGNTNDFSKYTLVKTLKKSKKQYIDKKLTANAAYSYIVRAYKTVDGKKYYISDYASVDLSFSSSRYLFVNSEVKNANGTVKVTWQKIVSAAGYVVEQYDENTGLWTTIKTLKNTTTSYTFPAATGEESVDYRIRAYKGTEYSQAYRVTVDPYLAAPTGVKAAANAADGSITVSWNAVAGADYYRVFRTTSSIATYYKNLGAYSNSNGDAATLTVYTADPAQKSGYKDEGTNVEGTTIVDRPITYTSNGVTNTVYAGPTAGVKYYYYVVAYKNKAPYNYADQENYLTASMDSKVASATVTSTTATKKPVLKAKKIKSSKGKVTVQWKKVAGAQGYVIYRSEKKKSGYTIVGSVDKGSTLKYVDGSVTKGKTYYYKVKAVKYNEAGVSVLSAFSKVKQIKAK